MVKDRVHRICNDDGIFLSLLGSSSFSVQCFSLSFSFRVSVVFLILLIRSFLVLSLSALSAIFSFGIQVAISLCVKNEVWLKPTWVHESLQDLLIEQVGVVELGELGVKIRFREDIGVTELIRGREISVEAVWVVGVVWGKFHIRHLEAYVKKIIDVFSANFVILHVDPEIIPHENLIVESICRFRSDRIPVAFSSIRLVLALDSCYFLDENFLWAFVIEVGDVDRA